MHIKINKKYLSLGDYKVKCAIGKRGISNKKKEGDLTTPKGVYRIKGIFYRKDKIKKLKSIIKKKVIKKSMGWCDDPKSKDYNKLIKYPFKYNSEKLFRSDNIYDIVVVLDFNMNPTKKNKGSAIFIHVTNNYKPTKGCIALGLNDLEILLKIIKKNSKIRIS